MKVDGKDIRPIWLIKDDETIVNIIDLRALPHECIVADLKTLDDMIHAIKEMYVRGAPYWGLRRLWCISDYIKPGRQCDERQCPHQRM